MNQQPQYPPEYVHATKKIIAGRLRTSPRRVSEMMEWVDDPLPVVYDKVTKQWVITEQTLAAWSGRHQLSPRDARQQGFVKPKVRRAI